MEHNKDNQRQEGHKDPELEYIERNLPAYQKACEGGEAFIRRGKLMTVGAAGDGKSCLIARLTGQGFRDEHVITNGLEADLMCQVNITYCDQTWAKYEKKSTDLLEDEFLHGMKDVLADQQGNKATPTTATIPHNMPTKVRNGTSPECAIEIGSDDEDATIESNSVIEPPPQKQMKYDMENAISKRRLQVLHHEALKQPSIGFPKKEKDCTIHIWDFAGQLQYYLLHHIFLRWRCVFILVINLFRDLYSPIPSHQMPYHSETEMTYLEQIEFWLNMIMSHAARSDLNDNGDGMRGNVVLVGTHKDLLPGNPVQQETAAQKYFNRLRRKLSNKAHAELICDFVAVDSKGGDPENYAKLRSILIRQIQVHCRWDERRPIRWLQLEQTLHDLAAGEASESMFDNLVRYLRVKELAKQYYIQTEAGLKTFLEFHHITADITYCSGNVLGKFVVTDPQWLINVLRSLITIEDFYPEKLRGHKEVDQLHEEGLVKIKGSLLRKVWGTFLPEDCTTDERVFIFKYFLRLMSEFDLAVEYEENLYLIPCMLPIAPNFHLQFQNVIPSIYIHFHASRQSHKDFKRGSKTYDKFLPHGLFQKVMSKCSKSGWRWIGEKYQDAVTFTTDGIIVSLQSRSTWIKVDVFNPGETHQVAFNRYLNTVLHGTDTLLSQFHPNMWYEMCVDPCAQSEDVDGCLACVGKTSLDKEAELSMAICKIHSRVIMPVKKFCEWFQPIPQGKLYRAL